MTYRIEYGKRGDSPSGGQFYYIYDDDQLIARYWHDHRGDDCGIDFVSGNSEDWPFSHLGQVLAGGGPLPLTLTNEAIVFLETRKSSGNSGSHT
jgi:hypothetical protein